MKTTSKQFPIPSMIQKPALESLSKLKEFKLITRDEDVGIPHDFLFGDETWDIRYVVVDVGHWLPGRKVPVIPSWMTEPIDWQNSLVKTSVTRDRVEGSPELDSSARISREYETRLHEHYGQTGYWLYRSD